MKYLKIINDGELDIRLVSLMGGTTKADDKYKIGQWGTGLKYVLSFLVRNNIYFRIFSGSREIKLTTKTEVIREQEFTILYIDGERSSITAQMGTDWKPWMIMREIWCNALDEGGHSKEVVEWAEGADGTTQFYIQLTPQIQEVLDSWQTYFIHNLTPIFQNEKFAIYPGGKDLRIYKQGVLIRVEENVHALFHYDIKSAQINELREYKGFMDCDIFKCLADADRKTAEFFLENCTEQHYEGKMDITWSFTDFGDAWKEAIGNSKLIHQKALDEIKNRGLEIDTAAVICVPKNFYVGLNKYFPGVGALRVADKVNEFFEIHSEKLDHRIKAALSTLETCGYFIDPELKFIYGIFGDKKVLAKVNLDSKEVLISEKLLDAPMFDIIAIIIEEDQHYKTGFDDCSRNFQQHFINLFTKTLLEKNAIPV